MKQVTLAAYTDPMGTYPAYTNFSVDGDLVTVSVRGSRKADGTSGEYVQHTMLKSEFVRMCVNALELLANS